MQNNKSVDVVDYSRRRSLWFVVVDRVGLWDKLPAIFGRPKDLTVFAPSNDAFNQLPAFMRHQLMGRHDNNACITSTLIFIVGTD